MGGTHSKVTRIWITDIATLDIVVKVRGRELIVLPEGISQYFTWELHQGLTRQTALLVVGLVIMLLVEAINPDKRRARYGAYHQVHK